MVSKRYETRKGWGGYWVIVDTLRGYEVALYLTRKRANAMRNALNGLGY